jgi:chloramphenicol 3-O phosphotransferase
MPSRIIYLNGPSSAGKSTLARALQDRLTEPFLRLSLDNLIEAMPERVNDWSGAQTTEGFSFQRVTAADGAAVNRVVAGPYGQRIPAAFRAMVAAIAHSGLDLIIDDIAFGADQVAPWREALRDCQILWVGVTATVEELERRERERGDRLVGSARDQLARTHAGVEYDLLIDTTALPLAAAVEQIIARLPAVKVPDR